MQQVFLKKEETQCESTQMAWQVPTIKELQFLNDGERVSIFHRGVCLHTYESSDRFSRNFCLAQLHLSSGFKIKDLSQEFGLQYQYCSLIIVKYKKKGLDGIRDLSGGGGPRRLITEKIGEFILAMRAADKSYEDISVAIRFRFKKNIKPNGIRTWVCVSGKSDLERSVVQEELKIEMPVETLTDTELSAMVPVVEEKSGGMNIYAGSMILYSMLERSRFLSIFERNIKIENKPESWSVRRVLQTLFFLHALRLKSVEQSKHLVGSDFGEIVGGDFLRVQWLRNAVDEIVNSKGFEAAVEEHYKNLVKVVERQDKIFYTDGHFSTYYGKQSVPKGYDPRRQMPYRGRNTIYLHNSEGENVYMFESPTNTSLSVDIEVLVADMERLGVALKGQTMCFDRGGYSAKCFRFLKGKKMYFLSYLKNRKKERLIDESLFEFFKILIDGEEVTLRLFEKEVKDTKAGRVRTIILLNDGKQIPVITTNPYLKMEEIVQILKQRWREENSFKYMVEHFGIDLLTTYKTEEAPDKVIVRPHPKRKGINKLLAEKKRELEKLQANLAKKVMERGEQSEVSIKDFYEAEKVLNFSIKNMQVDIDYLERQRRALPTKEKKSLREDHVVMAQKRRLLINMIKAMNYNAEKWMQEIFKKHHTKQDETLSVIRNLFRQPGRIIQGSNGIRVELKALDNGPMSESLDAVLESLKENNWLKSSDGRNLEICQMH